MRKIILSMEMSLNGFVEGDKGDTSWMIIDDSDLWADIFGMLRTVDTCILGRGMFEGYRDYWRKCLDASTCSADEHKYAKWADKTEHVLVSKTIKDPQWKNTKIVSGSVVDEVKKIKAQSGGDIYVVGGAMLARTLIEAKLIDEYRLTIVPFIIKEGKSLWNPLTVGHQLDFMDAKPLKSGALITRYRERR